MLQFYQKQNSGKKKKKSRCPHRYFSAKTSFELTSPVPCWLINSGCPSGWSRSAYLTFLRFPASSKITSGTVTSKNVNNFQNTRPLQSGMLVQLKLLHYRFKHLYRFRFKHRFKKMLFQLDETTYPSPNAAQFWYLPWSLAAELVPKFQQWNKVNVFYPISYWRKQNKRFFWWWWFASPL